MGDWFGTYHAQAIHALRDEQVPSWLAERLAKKLADAGVLVSSAYYVPDIDELFGLMKTIQYHLHRGLQGCRWVMCRETQDALLRKYVGKRTPAPFSFDKSFWVSEAGQELPSAALEMEVLSVIERGQRWESPAMLFGVPVRIDPAARSPLFEVDSEATRQRGEIWPNREAAISATEERP